MDDSGFYGPFHSTFYFIIFPRFGINNIFKANYIVAKQYNIL